MAADETGWRINGVKAWLWDFVGDGVTVYRILDGRGFDQAKQVLGEDFAGVSERDGWAAYRKFTQATHQTCYAHYADLVVMWSGDPLTLFRWVAGRPRPHNREG